MKAKTMSPSDGAPPPRRAALLAGATALAWLAVPGLSGCAAPGEDSEPEVDRGGADGYALQWGRPLTRKPGDGIILDRPGGSATLIVTSSSGIGEAQFQPTSGVWPRELRLEFRYAPGRPFTALEGLTLETRANTFDSSADWLKLKLEDLPQRRIGGSVWFTLPEDWLVGQQPLRLQWVDRYR